MGIRLHLGLRWNPESDPLQTGNNFSFISILFFINNTVIFFNLLFIGLGKMIDQRNKLIEEIKSVSLTDELTGLMNRRGFNNVSNYELARLGRSQKGYTVVICDIDHFKFVIDNFGHTCGDLVIKRFADILETNMRRGDTAARLGGEEFVVFLPETNKREAEIVLERIRKETGHQAVECKNESFTRTMSFVACFCDNPGIKIDTILSIADRNPYLAKESGRNRVVITIIRAVSR